MTLIVDKEILINAICGKGIEYGDKLVALGLATFDGDQHNKSWAWNRQALAQLTLDQLTNIYQRV